MIGTLPFGIALFQMKDAKKGRECWHETPIEGGEKLQVSFGLLFCHDYLACRHRYFFRIAGVGTAIYYSYQANDKDTNGILTANE